MGWGAVLTGYSDDENFYERIFMGENSRDKCYLISKGVNERRRLVSGICATNGLSVKSVEEAENIINPNIETLRKNKIDEMKQACKDYIYNGIDVELINGETKHFSLTLEDQMNLNGLVTQISIGNIKAEKGVPYHADGEMCTLFSIGDFTMIANKASEHVIKQITYCNHLMNYIKSLDTRENIESVYYGIELVGYFLDNYKGLTEHEEDNL